MRGIASIVLIALVGGTAVTVSLSAAYFYFVNPSDDSPIEVPLRNDSAEILTDGSDSDDISVIERFLLQPFGGSEQSTDSDTQTTSGTSGSVEGGAGSPSGEGLLGGGSQTGFEGGRPGGSGSQTGFEGGRPGGSGSQTGFEGGQSSGSGSQTGFEGGQSSGSGSQTGFEGGQVGDGSQTGFEGGQSSGSGSQTGSEGGQVGDGSQTGSEGGQSNDASNPQVRPAPSRAFTPTQTTGNYFVRSGTPTEISDSASNFPFNPSPGLPDIVLDTLTTPTSSVDVSSPGSVSVISTPPLEFVSDIPSIELIPGTSSPRTPSPRRPSPSDPSPEDSIEVPVTTIKTDKYGVEDVITGLLVAVGANVLACFAGALLGSLIPSTSVSTQDEPQKLKECTLDTIAYNVARSVASKLAAQYIQWASSGFEGRPLFIDNPRAYWSGIIDQEIGRALDSAGFGFLCRGGLSIDIEFELRASYSRYEVRDDSCSLSDYESNIRDSLDNAGNIINITPVFTPVPGEDVFVDLTPEANRNIGEDLSNLLDEFAQRAVDFDIDETPLGQIAEKRAQIADVAASVGEPPTAQEAVANDHKPSSLAAVKNCSGNERRLSTGFCTKISVDATTITDNIDNAIDAQVEALNIPDEFGEILGSVIQATIFGLLKNGFSEVSEVLTSTRTLRRESERLIRNPSRSSNDLSVELYESMVAYDDTVNNVIISLLEINDINTLLEYSNRSYGSGTLPVGDYAGPGSYKKISDGFFPSFYRETLPHVQRSQVKSFIDTINDSSRSIGRICSVYEGGDLGDSISVTVLPNCLATADVYGPGFTSSDFPALKNIFREGQIQIAEQKENYEALESILSSTIDAHIVIVGKSDEPFSNNLVISEIRNDILSSLEENDACNDFPPEVSSSERLRCAVNRIFSEGRAPVYVNNIGFQRLNSLSRELSAEPGFALSECVLDPSTSFSPSDAPHVGVSRSLRLVKTSCTIRDLINIIIYTQNKAPSPNAIPSDPGLLVEFMYEIGRNTGFIRLPVDSEIGILELTGSSNSIGDYQDNQRLSENYSLLTDFFAGNSVEVVLPSGLPQIPEQVNFGAYTARQSREIYIENVSGKIQGWFAERLLKTFLPE